MKSHPILCPVDYSDSSELAISVAVDLVKPDRSKTILLHVIEPHNPAFSVRQSIDDRLQTRIQAF